MMLGMLNPVWDLVDMKREGIIPIQDLSGVVDVDGLWGSVKFSRTGSHFGNG